MRQYSDSAKKPP